MEGFTLWFTGLKNAGKSTLAGEVGSVLLERGLKVEVLDGAEVRARLSGDLGFSKPDRETHARRVGYLCRLLSRNGVAAIAAIASPDKAGRDAVRAQGGRFVEVYCQCDLETLESRDRSGLYLRARRGEIADFPGVTTPHEPADRPEVTVDTGRQSIDACRDLIVQTLERLGYVPALSDSGYTEDEERKIAGRLEDLGYL